LELQPTTTEEKGADPPEVQQRKGGGKSDESNLRIQGEQRVGCPSEKRGTAPSITAIGNTPKIKEKDANDGPNPLRYEKTNPTNGVLRG